MPGQTKYVLALSQTPPRSGRVIAESDDGYSVHWHDGEQGMISKRAASLVRVRAGSLAELYASDPNSFRTIVLEDPARAYTLALRDWGASDKTSDPRLVDLRGRMIEFGLSAEDLKVAEKRVSTAFGKDRNIEKLKGGRWRWVDSPSGLSPEPTEISKPVSLSDVLAQMARPDAKKQPELMRELRMMVQSYDLSAASESDRMTAWSLDLLKEPPAASPEALADMPEPLLGRYLKASQRPPTQDQVIALAARALPSRIADAVVANQPAENRPEILLDALKFRRDRSARPTAGAPRIIERFSRSWTGEVPDAVVGELLDLLPLEPRHAQQVGHAIERLLTPTRAPMELLIRLLDSRDVGPLLASLRGLPWTPRGLRRRLFSAVAQGSHAHLLSDRQAWVPLEMADLIAMCQEDVTLRSVLLAGGDSDCIAAHVVAEWLPQEWTPAKIADAIQWPASLLAFLPDRILGSGMVEVTSKRPELKRLLEDASAVEAAREIERLAELARVQTEQLESELDHARSEACDFSKRYEQEQAQRQHAEELLREAHRSKSDVLAAQLRQAQIDAVMAVAAIIAELDAALASGSVSRNVHERAWLTASTLGLRQIDSTSGPIDFDPLLHQRSDGGTGGTVTVGTPGYTWNRDGERIVLRKALVTES